MREEEERRGKAGHEHVEGRGGGREKGQGREEDLCNLQASESKQASDLWVR